VKYEHDITTGRPYGEKDTLWSKMLKAKTFMNQDQSTVGLKVCSNTTSLFVNV